MTVITESDSFPQALAKRALERGYTSDDAPALAAIFTGPGEFPQDVTQEFSDEMNRRRLDAIRATFVSTPAKRAIIRNVLNVYAATGDAALAAAAITSWPSHSGADPEAEAGTAKACTPKAKRSRAAVDSRSRRTGVRPARLAGRQ
jgi:hypothetical protein